MPPHAPTAAGQPIAYGPVQAAHASGLTRTRIFEEIAAGRLKARKSGRRTLILRSELERYLNNLPVVER